MLISATALLAANPDPTDDDPRRVSATLPLHRLRRDRATALLATNSDPTDEEIRAGLSNLCRCTGYVGIVAAVHSAAKELAQAD